MIRRPWLVSLLLPLAVLGAEPVHDVVIRGARVLDGTGAPWRHADVALRGDRISAVGRVPAGAGRLEIDAAGLYLVPGFIDAHTHAMPALLEPALSAGRAQLAQGVTTVFVNHDGGGAVDLADQRRRLEEVRPGINVAPLVPHGSIRAAVMGTVNRAATAEELAEMKRLVRQGMLDGGFGLSVGTAYVPGLYSDVDEQIALARVAAALGGFYTAHIRSESDRPPGLVAAVDEVIAVAREASLPAIVTHIKALGPRVWGFSGAVIHRIEAARAEGLEIWADQYPYEASSTGLEASLPGWAQEGGGAAMRARLADPETRARIRPELAENIRRRGGPDTIQIARFAPDPSLQGRRLGEVARERAVAWEDLALDLVAAGRVPIVSFNMHENDIAAFMRQPWTMTCSDGGLSAPGDGVPHPRAYGAFPRKLRRYVLERGVVTLEQAVHSMTGLPAAVLRLPERGTIRPGAMADVAVFDLGRVRDVATYERPHEYAEGMVHVWVNGVHAWRDGAPTDERGGRVLRGPGAGESPAP